MKKLISLCLCAGLMLSMTSCSGTKTNDTERETEIETEASEVIEETDDTDTPDDFSPDFTFTTTDRDGREYTEAFFSQHEVTMVNFWEPWCGPCVGEMPELQQLYRNYSDKGFAILGVYSETMMESDVDQIISDTGVEYPILHYAPEFDQFKTGYVPTTVFVDRNGHILSASGNPLIVGANSYTGWEEIIRQYLGN
ncbi:MAG: TlpA family protein disulfide reductase [Clostridiales bacterium]|nr:TlpA family protein disulfide reductase [Clostridiales bacterium]